MSYIESPCEEDIPTIGEEKRPEVTERASTLRKVVVWTCRECGDACIPVRDESRCLW